MSEPSADGQAGSETILEIDDLTKRFGGLTAVDDLSFAVRENEILGFIGPNGAGKSTTFNCVMGVYTPTTGDVYYRNEAVTGTAPHEMVEHGVARTFQTFRPLRDRSVLANVVLPLMPGDLVSFARHRSETRNRARDICDRVGLGERLSASPSELPHAGLIRLEIARALATDPDVLLIDEAFAGLSVREVDEISSLLSDLRDRGVTIVIIDHNMRGLLELIDRAIVIDFGEKIATGTAAEIKRDPRVREAYLGNDDSDGTVAAGGTDGSEGSPRAGGTDDPDGVVATDGDQEGVGAVTTGGTDDTDDPVSVAGATDGNARAASRGERNDHSSSPVLQVADVRVTYDQVTAIRDVDLTVGPGEVVSIIGPNGAGKTSLANAIAGFRPYDGGVRYRGSEVAGRSRRDLVDDGLVYCTETRDLFGAMSVEKNLKLGAYRNAGSYEETLEYVYDLFPKLSERRAQHAKTLSGGEQQMLAIGRGLVADPETLILDEPTLGLAPVVIEDIDSAIEEIRARGISILLCEQNTTFAMQHSNRVYLLENGSVVREGPPEELQDDEYVQEAYLG